MDSQEKNHQAKRISRYNALDEAANELTNNLLILNQSHDNKPSHYTGNTSQVKRVRQIKISFDDGTDTLEFNHTVLGGYKIGDELRHLLEKMRKEIWEQMEKV